MEASERWVKMADLYDTIQIYGEDALTDKELRESQKQADAKERKAESHAAEIEARKAEMREAERVRREKTFKESMRARFFAVNGEHATEKDFERLFPAIKDEFLIDNMRVSGGGATFGAAVFSDEFL
jgi:hypothetical protein